MTASKSQTILIDTCKVHYLAAGNPADRTVLLLHGMKFQAATWEELGTMDRLAKAGFHAVAVDMPGFGKSPACALEQDRVLEKFINAIGLQSVIIAGPSMGGRIALEFTLNHAHLVDKLILIGAVGVAENQNRLGEITVPTLIVWGSEDQISPLENSDILHTAIANSTKIVIDGAPHPCYLDNPEKWHNAVIQFLDSQND